MLPAWPCHAAVDRMLMIEPPPPASIIAFATVWVMRNAPPMMMSIWRRNWSTGMSRTPLGLNWTALLINTSTRPQCSITAATSEAT